MSRARWVPLGLFASGIALLALRKARARATRESLPAVAGEPEFDQEAAVGEWVERLGLNRRRRPANVDQALRATLFAAELDESGHRWAADRVREAVRRAAVMA